MENLCYRATLENQFPALHPDGVYISRKDGDMGKDVYYANKLYRIEYSAARQQHKKSVLVVDCNEEERRYLLDNLRQGYKTVGVASGKDALENLKHNYYDLVISEIRLPEMTGIDLLKKVKTINPQVEVIIVTAYGDVETYIEAMSMGAFEYLTKPVKTMELRKILAKATLQHA